MMATRTDSDSPGSRGQEQADAVSLAIESPGPVLIFGAMGQAGQALMAGRGAMQAEPFGRDQVDISDATAVAAALDRHRPAAAINCAVFQPVDLCEQDPESAFRINATAAGRLAEACADRGIPLLHFSTDYVFGGDRRTPYPEDASPRPLSIYAASKLAGEYLVLTASSAHRVIRTSAVFGRSAEGHGMPSFVDRMLERALTGQLTRVVEDQTVSPTYAAHLAEAVWKLLACGEAGIFHVAGRGECSWYGLARRLFEAAGRPDLLARTTAAEFAAPARRPAYSALDCSRLRSVGIDELPTWEEGLASYLAAAHPELAAAV